MNQAPIRHLIPDTRHLIVAEARSWLGTPYRHQASCKGAGCDCLGLIRGVWRAVVGPEPEALPAYSRDWGDARGSEPLLAVGRRHLIEIEPADAGPGDILVFRMREGRPAKHAGILVVAPSAAADAERAISPPPQPSPIKGEGVWRLVHAQEGVGVVEVHLGRWWRRRVAGAFRFPEFPQSSPAGLSRGSNREVAADALLDARNKSGHDDEET